MSKRQMMEAFQEMLQDIMDNGSQLVVKLLYLAVTLVKFYSLFPREQDKK